MEADNVMTAETRSTGYYYRHYEKFTGEWERRWTANPQCLPERIHRDPEVRREGNDVTQVAFQSPYAHLAARYYERMIYARNDLQRRRRSGARSGTEGDPRSRQLPRAHPSANVRSRHVPTQQDMTMIPTGSEYAGVGNQKDFDPNADGVMVHADCYIYIHTSLSTARRGIRSMPVSLETPRETYSMEPLSADSETLMESPRHDQGRREWHSHFQKQRLSSTPPRQRSATSTEI
jgi:hypothetical protein